LGTDFSDMKREIIPDLAAATDPARLYPIRQSQIDGFYAGRRTQGQKLLAAVDGARLLVAQFNEAGDLIEVARAILPPQATTPDSQGQTVAQYLSKHFGYVPQVIQVKRFRVPPEEEQAGNLLQRALIGESGLAVAPFPTHLQEFLDDPSDYDEEDYTNCCEMLSRWITEGNFVLYWGNEYQLNPDGVVIAS
jgi:hypothetical protein